MQSCRLTLHMLGSATEQSCLKQALKSWQLYLTVAMLDDVQD